MQFAQLSSSAGYPHRPFLQGITGVSGSVLLLFDVLLSEVAQDDAPTGEPPLRTTVVLDPFRLLLPSHMGQHESIDGDRQPDMVERLARFAPRYVPVLAALYYDLSYLRE